MGNRAVIACNDTPKSVGIYLHWNGGVESIEAFLHAARDLGVSSADKSYFIPRLSQIIGNYFGGNLSIGIGTLDQLDCDNGDNGLYVIGVNNEIIKRKYAPRPSAYDHEKFKGVYDGCMEKNAKFFKEREAA